MHSISSQTQSTRKRCVRTQKNRSITSTSIRSKEFRHRHSSSPFRFVSAKQMAILSDLPDDMLSKIAKKLRKLEDFTSFRSVSKSLRAAAKDEYFEGLRFWHGIPYLMLSVKDDGDDDTRELYSLVEGESIVASVKVAEFKSKKCLESLGWLMASERDGTTSLLDPFSGTEIPLPHQYTFPGYDSVDMDEYGFFRKMVLSSRPSETSDFILVVIGGGLGELVFWRLGDKSWNETYGRKGAFVDVVYHGGGQFYAIGFPGLVWGFNFSGSDTQINGRIVTYFIPRVMIPNCEGGGIRNELAGQSRLYVLKAVDDSLLVITRSYPLPGEDDLSYVTSKFQVYEVDTETGTWKEIYSLGNMAVFVGHSSTNAVDASRFSGRVVIKSNHIYFTDDNWEFYHDAEAKGGGTDSGVYNMETGTVEPIYPGEVLCSQVSPSIWITPCF